MREHYSQLTSKGAHVIVITPSGRALLEPFIDAFGPFQFDIYGDPTRSLYKSMGHESMQKWKLLMKAGKAFVTGGSKAFIPDEENQKKVVKEALKTQDIYIQGGSWIFNENGEVVWKHIDSSPEDHASIDRILQELLS
ncbi:peroxiredoxin-like family protein [Robertmurraya sp.]|uniref:peroxiredoxin-like family protein n=1 Tax=Robertmurraya sp. TaxID=2837525 RepID=UPI0037047CB8